MIYLDADLDNFIEKTGLEIVDYHCSGCGGTFPTETPVMTKDSFGLQSRIHGCGDEFYTVILTPRTEEAKKFWDQIV